MDSELEYDTKISPVWGRCEEMFIARKQLFPHQVLGELSGWLGIRKELCSVLVDYGYTWTDLKYDYVSTVKNGSLRKPILAK